MSDRIVTVAKSLVMDKQRQICELRDTAAEQADEIKRLTQRNGQLGDALDLLIVEINPAKVSDWDRTDGRWRDEAAGLRQEVERLREELDAVHDMVDDILYDPAWEPVTETGERIRGDDLYLLEHPVQEDHMPALREWFVKYTQ